MRDVEIPTWLKGLPLAPEFHPTDTEFADPIAYISKIEKEASAFGICKVIPPLPKPSRKYVISNLNKSLLKCPDLFSDLNSADLDSFPKVDDGDKGNGGVARAVFTTRQQELGQSLKRTKGSVLPQLSAVQKQVWQSGEIYTLEQFESKSKAFTRSMLGTIKEVSPLVVETLFWKAASEKPIYVEYANDVPGSGFGEPQGQFRYFHKRRRRKRSFNRNIPVNVAWKKHEVDTMTNSQHNRDIDASTSTENKPNPFLETPIPSTSSSALLSDETCLDSGNEMQGTAGWKLSNSPWNLQIISRSAGSLTRFMPDDIPGVTSPMVYIGMLFSWFAWHIEDHELHSLNFLHTGSPKTWYAVPGEYASAFEEVIRKQVYGGNLDLLAVLTHLGEKTTLLSPDVVVLAGIPCCRLIQNPGEFVVTFPRAYHVGFSHGFNCGEAANFGTPQWLKVAKEAAVRRAAMNYLPMLSHQQLLYLLTMSFVSRVPRSLLPGARNSRLRDRQKEERELLVKKAFIEDMLNENKFASVLIGKQTTYRAALWNPDSLPSPSKESQLHTEIGPVAPIQTEKDSLHSENYKNQNNLFDEMRLYLENINDLYVDDADLYCDFQVDSGTLACVACGILGFPFMCILQPSERASMKLLHEEDHLSVEEADGVSKPQKSYPPKVNGSVLGSVSGAVDDQDETQMDIEYSECKGGVATTGGAEPGRDFKLVKDTEMSSTDANNSLLQANDNKEMKENDLSHRPPVLLNELDKSTVCHAENPPCVPMLSVPAENLSTASMIAKEWSGSSGFLRPRIFCLEHAFQIEELFQSKGGTNVLVICHSDYQKIKVHAEVIAEEIGTRFDYDEIPLENASQVDLNLINLAIDDEEHNQRGEDWTSKLGINLQYCVKVKKNSLSKQLKHALKLGGLFCEATTSSNLVDLKWLSTRSRSKHKPNYHSHREPCQSIQSEKVDMMGTKFEKEKDESIQTKNEDKIIQYSRRRTKCKKGGPAGASEAEHPRSDLCEEVPSANCENLYETSMCTSDNNPCGIRNTIGDSASVGNSEMQRRMHLLNAAGSKNSLPTSAADLQHADLHAAASCAVENLGALFGDQTSKEKHSNSATFKNSEVQVIVATEGSDEKIETYAGNCVSSLGTNIPVDKFELHVEDRKGEGINKTEETCDVVTLDNSEVLHQHDVQANGDIVINKVSGVANLCPVDMASGTCGVLVKKTDVEQPVLNDEVCDRTSSDLEVHHESINAQESGLSCVAPVDQPTHVSVVEDSAEVRKEASATEDMVSGDVVVSSRDDRETENVISVVSTVSTVRKGSKRKAVELLTEIKLGNDDGYIRSPCEGLRPRTKQAPSSSFDIEKAIEAKPATKRVRKSSDGSVQSKDTTEHMKGSHVCDLEGCRMSFKTKSELLMHKRNQCPYQGCGKRFSSHKYAVLHRRVHDDKRPLKCPWKDCDMSFKWAWARTEHLRVHTGERPYHCEAEGCGLTFRYVSDFSRHRRKTGHRVNLPS